MPRQLEDWLHFIEQAHPVSIELGLNRCGQVYQRMGSPRPARTVITVAGTNGKGSTVAWLDALLRGLGKTCSSYTSPHIMEFTERLKINGRSVSAGELVTAFEHVERARQDVPLTYFEFTTLACFFLSARSDCEFAILEVGLGGRLDTVNLVDADLVIVTPIGLDHQSFLGNDIQSIALEKAGVFRQDQRVVCSEPAPPVALLERAIQLNCYIWINGGEFDFQATQDGARFQASGLGIDLPAPGLAGEHQFMNLAGALAGLARLLPDLEAHQDMLARSIRDIALPGRLQAWEREKNIIFDVGHNPLAARVIATWLDANGFNSCRCVLGMLADKDVEHFVALIGDRVNAWYCGTLPGVRGQQGNALAGRVSATLPNATVAGFESIGLALDQARQDSSEDECVLLTGSFETVSRGLEHLQAH